MVQVISYYTVDTPYEREIEKLRKSCKEFNIPLETMPIKNQGNWLLNCGMKPFIISSFLAKYHADNCRDFLYVDADAVFKRPIDSDFNYEFGYYRLRGELLSGTLYMKNNFYVRKLIHVWCAEQQNNPTTFDQKVLDKVISKTRGIKFGELPPEYIKIFDNMHFVTKPVIVHNQASRRFKNVISRVS